MNALVLLESVLGWVGGLAALAVLMANFVGIGRGLRRPTGRAVGQARGLLKKPWFYGAASLVFLGLCFYLWRPLPLRLTPAGRAWALAGGGLAYFSGLALVLWSRLALGDQYFVSTSLGAQLFAGHRLVTSGPYALVRHPMYLGLLLAGLGGVGLYRTWAMAFFVCCCVGLPLRARREERLLSAEFGEAWQDYRRRTPAFFPLRLPALRTGYAGLRPGEAALLEVCILFLPAIPAYLWVWPVLAGLPLRIADILTHVYVLAGTLYIGLRRWNADQLGLNGRGVWLSLAFGLLVILGRSLVILAFDWGLPPSKFSPPVLLGEFIYYFAMIGFVQEFLFRGLVYRAFEDWLGTGWAIWGSSVGFGLWHVFGGGPLIGLATLLYGLIFGLLRWRAGGILGLILVHGAMDYLNLLMLPDMDVLALGRPAILSPALAAVGLGLILATPVILWRFFPRRGAVLR